LLLQQTLPGLIFFGFRTFVFQSIIVASHSCTDVYNSSIRQTVEAINNVALTAATHIFQQLKRFEQSATNQRFIQDIIF
jgi:hypothetical protein